MYGLKFLLSVLMGKMIKVLSIHHYNFFLLSEAELFVNGKSRGKMKADQYSILEWKYVDLKPGKNKIEIKTTNKKQPLTDMYYCIL